MVVAFVYITTSNIHVRKFSVYRDCGILVAQNELDIVEYAAPDIPAHSVELGRCGDDSMLIVSSFVVQSDGFGGQLGDRCDTTPTFAEFCEATVRCRFTQTEFRAAVRDVCGADYDQGQIAFAYRCLPGTRGIITDNRSDEILYSASIILRFVHKRYNNLMQLRYIVTKHTTCRVNPQNFALSVLFFFK